MLGVEAEKVKTAASMLVPSLSVRVYVTPVQVPELTVKPVIVLEIAVPAT